MDELELDDFRHGGVNITGFSLLDDNSSSRLLAFQREWSHLDPKYWHGAGRGRKITVRQHAGLAYSSHEHVDVYNKKASTPQTNDLANQTTPKPTCLPGLHRRRSSVNFRQDIFARKYV